MKTLIAFLLLLTLTPLASAVETVTVPLKDCASVEQAVSAYVAGKPIPKLGLEAKQVFNYIKSHNSKLSLSQIPEGYMTDMCIASGGATDLPKHTKAI